MVRYLFYRHHISLSHTWELCYVEGVVGSVWVSENEGEKVWEKLERVGEVGEDRGK